MGVWVVALGVVNHHVDLAAKVGVLPLLGSLDGVPEFGPVVCPLGRVGRGQNLGVVDTALTRVVKHLSSALVGNLHPCAISCCSGRTATCSTAYWFCR